MTDILTITDRAAERIIKIISEAQEDILGVRVGVDKTGCSGNSYKIEYAKEKKVEVLMTLTSPNCPVAESLPKDVSQKIKELKGMKSLAVYLTFDPPWDQDKMSEDAKLALDIT